MASDYAWVFDPDRSDGGVIVNDVSTDGGMPEYKPGNTIDLELSFWGTETQVQSSSGGTAGTATGFTAGGAAGATAGNVYDDVEHIDRYEAVREYTYYAGRYSLNTSITGVPSFMERLPSDASVPSIIVAVEPGAALDRTPGLWVAIDDVDDQSKFVDDTARVTLTATILARRSEYATRTDIKTALGSDLA